MAMFGQVEDLISQTPSNTRLWRGLTLLQNYQAGRAAEIASLVANLKPGENARVPVEGSSLYVLIQSYELREAAQVEFEAHEHYTDLQYLVAGRECIAVCDRRKQAGVPAFDQNGNTFFPMNGQPAARLFLEAGDLAVLFPQDAHAPCLRVEGGGGDPVCKIVVKIKHALLPAVCTHNEQPQVEVASASRQ